MTIDDLKRHVEALLASLHTDAGVDAKIGILYMCPACGIADTDHDAVTGDAGECSNCGDGLIRKLITVKMLDPEG
jgi:predicted RNA-binding Zn-ribbon protein involved in translation (DUF1610 family)